MVIAALVVFGALLAAWLAGASRASRHEARTDVAPPMAEGLAEAA